MAPERLFAITAAFIAMLGAPGAFAEPIEGAVGASSTWGSGWIDLTSVTHFQKGDNLRILVGGTADKILLRFLSRGMDPNTASGIDGGVRDIPEDRLLHAVVESGHREVTQVSVLGGPNPFGLMSLGSGNGPATIISIERASP